ncbi:MAG: indole-3-glycerol phosphate synthase TrpC [Lachnospiraceae bacterium]|uniref:Indole-3-glycerol phosphate synthase n=1 Tax=Candidatus Weimeria bifida TaxID=2599074 RepID=A0A6N7J0I5_9FIRM|nr:indole-3-glycerol phosphate synthase TrpC [Candidatus Weimeria bifida]RRF96895.1 MAG: indole-3-glycerol phosphate synthase TrpC [Lachnospiraceae bacterium]
MNILDEIAQKTRERINEQKKQISPEKMHKAADMEARKKKGPSFFKALNKPGISFICEVKKASPSKGLIAPEFPYLQIARDYEAAGADAISCLTEPYWFLGMDQYLKEITEKVNIPVLRKDFTVDEYMVDQARVLGASAVLLICAILTEDEIKRFKARAEELGMDALVEAHNEEEIRTAIECGAKIIGVNNRNLKDFTVDLENTKRLVDMVPPETVFVSESGMKTAVDVANVAKIGADAVLIGETLMRAADKKKKLEEMKGELR